MTPLDRSLKRALKINGHDYVIALTPDALKITRKGHRLGVELKWPDLVSGESALAVALHASVGKFQDAPQPVVHEPLVHEPKEILRRHAKTKAATIDRRKAGKRSSRKRVR